MFEYGASASERPLQTEEEASDDGEEYGSSSKRQFAKHPDEDDESSEFQEDDESEESEDSFGGSDDDDDDDSDYGKQRSSRKKRKISTRGIVHTRSQRQTKKPASNVENEDLKVSSEGVISPKGNLDPEKREESSSAKQAYSNRGERLSVSDFSGEIMFYGIQL